MCFIRSKDDTTEHFTKYLVDIAPRKVKMLRSNGGRRAVEGEFGALCTAETIKQEFTTVDTPELNGVAERQIAIKETGGLAARIQAFGRYSKEAFPKGERPWAEQASWERNALNSTTTSANPKFIFPYEMWYYGTPTTTKPIAVSQTGAL